MLIILGTVYGGTCMREPYSDIFIPYIKPCLSPLPSQEPCLWLSLLLPLPLLVLWKP